MSTDSPVSVFTRVRDIQKRARERKSDLGAHSNIIANLQPSPQPEPEVPPSQRAFTEAQNELNKLIEENKQLKHQIKDQAELKSRIVYLERADRRYREITRRLRRFKAVNGWIARRPPQFDVSRTRDSSSASRLQTAPDDMWLHMIRKS
jgi:vacuolar-type H+-ATPase subunit I/STV1